MSAVSHPAPLFVAVDGGAREALDAVAQAFGATVSHTPPSFTSDASALLVVGTSDSEQGRRTEAAARRAARSAGVPIAAIEDFPGNYVEVSGGEADLVMVESATAVALHATRGTRAAIEVFPPARYDRYREQVQALRASTAEAWVQDAAKVRRRRVFWAGQPETDDALRTLEVLIPVLRDASAELLFKAHPRDQGYPAGAYADLMRHSGLAVQDVTSMSTREVLASAPHVIVTQFSSVAIEAGFYGIPGVWLLLADAGAARLEEKKGYSMPPICAAGAALSAGSEAVLRPALELLLADDAYRTKLIHAFDRYFHVDEAATPRTVARLRQLAAKQK